MPSAPESFYTESVSPLKRVRGNQRPVHATSSWFRHRQSGAPRGVSLSDPTRPPSGILFAFLRHGLSFTSCLPTAMPRGWPHHSASTTVFPGSFIHSNGCCLDRSRPADSPPAVSATYGSNRLEAGGADPSKARVYIKACLPSRHASLPRSL